MNVPGKSRSEMSEEQRLAARKRDKVKKAMREMGKPYNVFPHELEAARAKLNDFHSRGMGWSEMDAQVPGKSVRHILGDVASGRRTTVRRPTYEMIMGLRFVLPDSGQIREGAPMDSTGSMRRIEALRALGFPENWLAEYAGFSAPQNIRWRAGLKIFRSQRDKISDMYEKLRDREPEEFGIAAPGLARARTTAARHNFPGPFCWDDDTIDDPEAFPEWTGVCGTVEGATVHAREGIPVCSPCREASRGHSNRRSGGRFSATKFRIMMEQRKVSVQETADGVQSTGDSIRRWAGGQRQPGEAFFDRICAFLDCEAGELMDSDGEAVFHDSDFNAGMMRSVLDGKGVPIRTVAHAIGVSNMAVQYWLNGRNKPKIPNVVKAAEFLGVDWKVFYE